MGHAIGLFGRRYPLDGGKEVVTAVTSAARKASQVRSVPD